MLMKNVNSMLSDCGTAISMQQLQYVQHNDHSMVMLSAQACQAVQLAENIDLVCLS